MMDKELYRQRKQIQLNEWKSGMVVFRTQAFAARTNVQVELAKHVKMLDNTIEELKLKLTELAKITGNNFDVSKKIFETHYESLRKALAETPSKFQAITLKSSTQDLSSYQKSRTNHE
ncbi:MULTISPECIES: hypothetical protein [Sulfurospirillum]|uniref:hypothetical protein n=1 Tax=Sulfurospirillum TaxID=57665 RepID=UPI0005AB4160|nr:MULTISPECIES: hypothetical protein [Sulfurospirillum]MCP3651391.1 hypothetical protein [Sulfurospirillum sp. DNRA8]MCR1810238.1 hypothetical protein [Sulfurospirillum sp. DNRA8]